MKKKLIIAILLTVMAGNVYAKDVTITITIPEAYIPQFRTYFFELLPIPMIENPALETDPNAVAMIPEYTEKKSFKLSVIRWIKAVLRKGKIRYDARMSTAIDPNTVQ